MKVDARIKLVVLITERKNGVKAADLLNENGYDFHTAMLARGTAPTEIASYLGLSEPEKVIFNIFLDEERAKKLLALLEKELLATKGGGIAFTVPVGGASNLKVAKLAMNVHE